MSIQCVFPVKGRENTLLLTQLETVVAKEPGTSGDGSGRYQHHHGQKLKAGHWMLALLGSFEIQGMPEATLKQIFRAYPICIGFKYLPPEWLHLPTEVVLTVRFMPLYYSLFVRIVIPYEHPVWCEIEMGDINKVQGRISKRELSPHAATPKGTTLLQVRSTTETS